MSENKSGTVRAFLQFGVAATRRIDIDGPTVPENKDEQKERSVPIRAVGEMESTNPHGFNGPYTHEELDLLWEREFDHRSHSDVINNILNAEEPTLVETPLVAAFLLAYGSVKEEWDFKTAENLAENSNLMRLGMKVRAKAQLSEYILTRKIVTRHPLGLISVEMSTSSAGAVVGYRTNAAVAKALGLKDSQAVIVTVEELSRLLDSEVVHQPQPTENAAQHSCDNIVTRSLSATTSMLGKFQSNQIHNLVRGFPQDGQQPSNRRAFGAPYFGMGTPPYDNVCIQGSPMGQPTMNRAEPTPSTPEASFFKMGNRLMYSFVKDNKVITGIVVASMANCQMCAIPKDSLGYVKLYRITDGVIKAPDVPLHIFNQLGISQDDFVNALSHAFGEDVIRQVFDEATVKLLSGYVSEVQLPFLI